MSNNTSIEWCDATWNPVVGCTKVSPGCANCYAEKMAFRLANMGVGEYPRVIKSTPDQCGFVASWNGKTAFVEPVLQQPMRWRKPRRIFVCSMSDLFHEGVPFEFIDKVFAVMALCPQHTFLVLTKRPERMAEYLYCSGARRNIHICNAATEIVGEDFSKFPGNMAHPRSSCDGWWPLPNVWLGTSIENQATADQRIPHLLRCPAAVRFLSVEPLLGSVDLESVRFTVSPGYFGNAFRWGHRPGTAEQIAKLPAYPGVSWCIVGGESGPNARPCNVEWIRSIVVQCKAAGVNVFVKQVGAKPYEDVNDGPSVRSWGEAKIQINGEYVQVHLRDRKGGDPSEWPEDLRVRQWPEAKR